MVLDFRILCNNGDSNFAFSVANVETWEKSNNLTIPAGAIVFFRTGKGDVYGDAPRYYGWRTEETARRRDIKAMNYPGRGYIGCKKKLKNIVLLLSFFCVQNAYLFTRTEPATMDGITK